MQQWRCANHRIQTIGNLPPEIGVVVMVTGVVVLIELVESVTGVTSSSDSFSTSCKKTIYWLLGVQ